MVSPRTPRSRPKCVQTRELIHYRSAPTKRIAHLGTAGDCCAAGFRACLCRLRVKSGKAQNEQWLSALCQKRTHALEQISSFGTLISPGIHRSLAPSSSNILQKVDPLGCGIGGRFNLPFGEAPWHGNYREAAPAALSTTSATLTQSSC